MELHLPLILKYAAAAVLFGTAAYFTWHDRLERQFFALILAGCFAAIGVNIVIS